ncbi:MAG: hypothetical protein IKG87_01035 [Clostridia bacterium]|nr:hypothetical protein [Clostridia bacterium]
MSWETILIALIAALGPLIGTILPLRQQSHFIDYRMGQVEDRIVKLSEKVDKHNSFDRRLVAVETKLEIRQDKP